MKLTCIGNGVSVTSEHATLDVDTTGATLETSVFIAGFTLCVQPESGLAKGIAEYGGSFGAVVNKFITCPAE